MSPKQKEHIVNEIISLLSEKNILCRYPDNHHRCSAGTRGKYLEQVIKIN
ncbi:hypothetical protein M3204_03650 [Mesobacillus subterraneus]|nr:hypothetical protein [Mesobacillus subterraneus]MCM3663482.1 hypothetical protein [Mesobacillus subterraneus]MCM3683252.1 hypothetical protein [Mesobacillus subterraneus]